MTLTTMIFKEFKNKKLSFWILALITFFSAFGSYTKLVYEFGRIYGSKTTTIELLKPFDFKVKVKEEEFNPADKTINLQKIHLVKSSMQVDDNNELYIVRKITDDLLITQEIGSITTKKKLFKKNEYWKSVLEYTKKLLSLTSTNFVLMEKAYAQILFQWYGYENNYNFREEYIDELTIRRHYQDEAILEYKVDDEGTSIPTTFKWINLPNQVDTNT